MVTIKKYVEITSGVAASGNGASVTTPIPAAPALKFNVASNSQYVGQVV